LDAVILDKAALQAKMEESLADGGDDDTDYINQISALTGYQPVDDKGVDVAYANDIDGISKYVSDSVRQEGTRLFEESQANFFTAYPQMKDAFNYLKVNNSLEGYGKVTDHSKVKLDKDNEEQLSEMIIQGEILRGRTMDQAKRQVKYAKDDNRLFEEGTENLTFVQTTENASVAAREASVAATNQKVADDAATYWGGIKTTIDSGKLEGYIIPENIQVRDKNGVVTNKARSDFYNFVSQTVDNAGNSAAANARATRPELDLLIDYVMFTGGDIKSLIDLQVKKTNAKTFKLQTSKHKSNNSKIVIGKAKDTSKVNNDNIV